MKNTIRALLGFLFPMFVAALLLATTPAMANFAAGQKRYDAGDFAGALQEWQPLAEKGEARAQGQIARLYYRGEGVGRDNTKALEWARKAVAGGDAAGQLVLGVLYYWGKGGLAKDEEQAAKLFRQSADQGWKYGQYWMGVYLMDHVAFGDAADWLEKAARQNLPEAESMLGKLYERGDRTPEHDPDFKEAMRRYRIAIERNDASGMFLLGRLYVIKFSAERVRRMFDREESDEIAYVTLLERNVPRDLVLGYALLSLAEQKKDTDAAELLAAIKPELSPEQLAEAQGILATWKPGTLFPMTSKTGVVPRVAKPKADQPKQ